MWHANDWADKAAKLGADEAAFPGHVVQSYEKCYADVQAVLKFVGDFTTAVGTFGDTTGMAVGSKPRVVSATRLLVTHTFAAGDSPDPSTLGR